MKRRKINWLIFVVASFFSICAEKGLGQSSSVIKDTVYVFLCKGTIDNGRLITSYAVYKDLSTLADLSEVNSQDSFMCQFFRQSVLLEEPYFTLTKNKKLYNFSSEKKANAFLQSLSKEIGRLNHAYSIVTTRTFTNNRSVKFQCARLIGEFWCISKSKDEINSYNHSFLIGVNCYDKSYLFNIKDIIEIKKLTAEELKIITRAIK